MSASTRYRRSPFASAPAWLGAGLLLLGGATLSRADAEPAADGGAQARSAVTETDRSKRLREIDREIALEMQRLIDLIAEPPSTSTPPLRENPELRELATRLPRLQEERRRLLAEPVRAPLPSGQP